MEKLKNKHDHALTQWLKVIIFAVLLMAPFFSVLTRCLYVTCNKNAKDSYSDNYINSTFKISSNNQLTLNTYYEITNITENNQNSNIYYYSSISNNNIWTGFPTDYDYVAFSFTKGGTNYGITLYYYNANNTLISIERHSNGISFVNERLPITFKLSNFESISSNTYSNYTMSKFTYKEDTLDNAFVYSVNQLTQTPIFNWVQNTAIYTPVNSMTTGLGFDASNNVLALLLTYWALLTAVYVVFDIVISCFTKITHLISGNS